LEKLVFWSNAARYRLLSVECGPWEEMVCSGPHV